MLSHMHEVLGTRYCEPTAMKANMIMTKAMQLIMKGTFNRAALLGVRHWHALADARRAGTALPAASTA